MRGTGGATVNNAAHVSEAAKMVTDIAVARYLQPDEEDMDDVYRRAMRHIYPDSPDTADVMIDLAKTGSFMPNSPLLMNAGTSLGQLSACYALGIDDSWDSIASVIHLAGKIFQSGGGVGYNLSRIRPAGSPVRNSSGVASGPVSFLEIFNTMTETIKQGGKRRGAQIAILNDHHPDIETFLSAKGTEGKFSNCNHSIRISDDFMRAVEADGDWGLHFNGVTHRTVRATDLFDQIADYAWRNGEPGVQFGDTVTRTNTCPHIDGEYDTSNPCGEQFLRTNTETNGGECCTLGHVGLHTCVTSDGKFDFDRLTTIVNYGVRFLDDVIDRNHYPTPEIAAMVHETRKIGLGVMGLADALIMMGIPYNSPEGIEMSRTIAEAFDRDATEASSTLAAERGTFPAWEGSTWHERGIPMRNAMVTTVAPTGTTSQFAWCSASIEPTMMVYDRKNTIGGKYFVIHPLFEKALDAFFSVDSTRSDSEKAAAKNEVVDHVHKYGTIQDITWLPEHIRTVFVTSIDVSWEYHLEHLAIWANHIHNSVSKTVILPNSATVDDVKQVYMNAWKRGVKGVTVYRQGSRKDEVYSLKSSDPDPVVISQPYEPPEWAIGVRHRARSGCGMVYDEVFFDIINGEPVQIENFINSTGGCRAFGEGQARTISQSLQCGVPAHLLAKQLRRVRCPTAEASHRAGKADGKSCSAIIGSTMGGARDVLLGMIAQVNGTQTVPTSTHRQSKNICPDCGEPLHFGEGCGNGTCRACGWSGCA